MSLAELQPTLFAAITEDLAAVDRLPHHVRFLLIEDDVEEGRFGAIPTTAPGVGELLPSAARASIVYPFNRTRRVTLGRSAIKSDIVIHHPRVSALHAAIAPKDEDSSWLIDLTSSNGTFLESRSLAPGEAGRATLMPGARLRLACVRLRFLDKALLLQAVLAAQ